MPEGGPDGGDGGRGGHVVFRGSHDSDSLIALYFAPQLFAEAGVPGRGQRMFGRNGKDLVVPVPCGTEVYDVESGTLLADVLSHGQEVVIARGGKGGLGNVHFKTATHQAPTEHTPGDPGEEFRLRLELKTIADAGLLGFPNAGKSSLLTCVSDARPKIASYPFTTLNPIVGTVEYPDFSQLRVADVPGIIDGAASGTGLGIDFLRHIARSRVLVYVIDMAGTDGREPWTDYRGLRREVRQYDASLLDRPSLVVANKMDEPAAVVNLPVFVKKTRVSPIPVSTIETGDKGAARFKQRLWEILRPEPRGAWQAPVHSCEPEASASFGDDGIVTEETLRRASFLDLSRKASKRRK